MRKTIFKSALVAIVGVGLMAGSASALVLEEGTKLVAIDGMDTDTTVDITSDFTATAWNFELSTDGINWLNIEDGNVATLADHTVFDLALYNIDTGNRFTLSGDGADDSYSVTMDFGAFPLYQSDAQAPLPFNLTEYFHGVDIQWTFDAGSGITDTHTIDATLFDHDGMAPVPEPATMLLFGTGLVGLAGLRRKKTQEKA